MNMKQICGAAALALVMSVAVAQAADAPAAAAPAATTEKCDVTKDGKTTTVDVAAGTCVSSGGKLSAAPAAPASGAAMAPAAPAAAPADKK
jgi:hypothetical protein